MGIYFVFDYTNTLPHCIQAIQPIEAHTINRKPKDIECNISKNTLKYGTQVHVYILNSLSKH